MKVKSLSCVWCSVTPWTAAYQAPPCMGFSRQKYWSGLPLFSPEKIMEGKQKKHEVKNWELWNKVGMEEPGGLPSIGSHRVGHDWSDLAAAAAAGGAEVNWLMWDVKNRVMWKLTLPNVDSQWELAVWLRELKPGICNNPGGGRGGWQKQGSRERGHMYPYGWFMLLFGRSQHNFVKQLSFN